MPGLGLCHIIAMIQYTVTIPPHDQIFFLLFIFLLVVLPTIKSKQCNKLTEMVTLSQRHAANPKLLT